MVFAHEVLGFFGNLLFQLAVETGEMATHAVEAVVHDGEFGGIVFGDVFAELAVLDGDDACFQIFERADNPDFEQDDGDARHHENQHHQRGLEHAQPLDVIGVVVFYGAGEAVDTGDEVGNQVVVQQGEIGVGRLVLGFDLGFPILLQQFEVLLDAAVLRQVQRTGGVAVVQAGKGLVEGLDKALHFAGVVQIQAQAVGLVAQAARVVHGCRAAFQPQGKQHGDADGDKGGDEPCGYQQG